MNVSRVGMTQPSFKGWISDGKISIKDSAVVMINAPTPSSYASIHLSNGSKIDTRLNMNQVKQKIDDAKNGDVRVPEYTFMA